MEALYARTVNTAMQTAKASSLAPLEGRAEILQQGAKDDEHYQLTHQSCCRKTSPIGNGAMPT